MFYNFVKLGKGNYQVSDQEFDFFICHASEDKKEIAEPLAELLKKQGMSVWLDKEQLKIGDSLFVEIQNGLKKSKCAVVIISKAFLEKKSWNESELKALVNMEIADKYKRLLPVLHDVEHNNLVKEYPMMADIVAGTSKDGLKELTLELIKAKNKINLKATSINENINHQKIPDLITNQQNRLAKIEVARELNKLKQSAISYGSQNAADIYENFQEMITNKVDIENINQAQGKNKLFSHIKNLTNVYYKNLSYMHYKTNKWPVNNFDEPFVFEIYFCKTSESVSDKNGPDLIATLTTSTYKPDEFTEMWKLSENNESFTTQQLIEFCLNELIIKANEPDNYFNE